MGPHRPGCNLAAKMMGMLVLSAYVGTAAGSLLNSQRSAGWSLRLRGGSADADLAPAHRSNTGYNTGLVDTKIVYRPLGGAHDVQHWTVLLVGSWSEWGDRQPLAWNTDQGLFECTVALPVGVCEFKFIVNGHWVTAPDYEVQKNPVAASGNNMLQITAPPLLPTPTSTSLEAEKTDVEAEKTTGEPTSEAPSPAPAPHPFTASTGPVGEEGDKTVVENVDLTKFQAEQTGEITPERAAAFAAAEAKLEAALAAAAAAAAAAAEVAAIDKKIEEEKVFRHQAAALAGEHTKTVTQDPMPPQASETPAANTLHTLHTPPPSPPLSPQPHAGDSASSAKDVAATTSVVSAATGGNAPTDQRALKSAAGEACADVAAAAAAAAKSNKSASQKSPAAQAAEAAMRRDREAEINARIQKRKEALASLRGEIQRNAKFVANTAIAFAPVLAPAVAFAVGRGLSGLVKGPKPEPKKPHPFAFLGYTENKKK